MAVDFDDKDLIAVLTEQRNYAMTDAAQCAARALGLSRENTALRARVAELEKQIQEAKPADAPAS